MNCARCGVEIRVRPNVKYCDTCRILQRDETNARVNARKKLIQRSARLENNIVARQWKKQTDEDTLQDVLWFIKQIDAGTSSPVIHYSPGHPMFEKIANQCVYIERISP